MTELDTKALARDLIAELFDSGSVTILVIKDNVERETYLNAHKAFSCLYDTLWGEFYDKHIDHGDCSGFADADAAVQAYRQFIADTITEAGLGELV
jgi:hypothetical protein